VVLSGRDGNNTWMCNADHAAVVCLQRCKVQVQLLICSAGDWGGTYATVAHTLCLSTEQYAFTIVVSCRQLHVLHVLATRKRTQLQCA
jgi:hypothetical protein